jgi:2-succinyl-5-enolpyruvyl-6-hydroxy-3-cyclohexene-1-carboxylate synthase
VSGRAGSGGAGSGGAGSGGGVPGAVVPGGEPVALTVFERTFGTPHGASLEQLAAAFGIPYTLARRPGDVAKAIAATVPGAGPRIVEVRTGRAANAELRDQMRAAAIRAIAPAG